MARARNIKPSFFKNENLAELPFSTRLLFVGLWMLADREGRLEDRPKRIKMETFPGDDVNVEKGLAELHAAGFIHRYEVDGSRYLEVCAFLKHQNPHHREPPSTIPKPEASPPLQPPSGPRLDTDGTTQKPEASPRPAPERHVLAGLNPSSLNPESPSLNPESGEKKERSPSGSRLALETLPDDWRSYCKTERPELNPDRLFLDFHDHWIAKAGKDGRKADWDATWRVWVRKEGQFGRPQAKPGESLYERNLRAVGIEPGTESLIGKEKARA